MNKKIKYPILFLLLLLIIGSSYQMLQLPLWGYWTLLQFISTWSFIVLLLEKRFSRFPQNSRWLFLSTLSGLLLAIGFPTSPLTPIMFIGFVPILMIERELSQHKEGPSKAVLFRYSYHAFVVWNILTTFWVGNTAYIGGVVAILTNSLFMSVPIVLFHQTSKVLRRNFAPAAFIAYWLAWEYLHLNWEISWPWLTLGNSFAQYPSWVQWYEYTGAFGGSFWILLVNVLVVKWLITDKEMAIRWDTKVLLKIGGIILIPIMISLGIYHSYEEQGALSEVVVVQPNFEPHYEKFAVPQRDQLEQFVSLSKEALSTNTNYLVFPETSLGVFYNKNVGKERYTRSLKELVDEYPKLNLVTGLVTRKIFRRGEEELHTRATRTHIDRTRRDTIYWELYNAAVQISAETDSIPIYFKSKQVPGAEMMPYPQLFFFLKPLADKLGGSLSGHGKQKERTAFKSSSGGVGPMICYESVYGEYATGYVRHGANALFIITNDGWWDNTPGHLQHLKFASLRAIETRRAIARSANTGISCFVNQRGDILQATKYNEATAIRGQIPMNNNYTFYVRWGDVIGRIAVFLTILLLLNSFVKSKMG